MSAGRCCAGRSLDSGDERRSDEGGELFAAGLQERYNVSIAYSFSDGAGPLVKFSNRDELRDWLRGQPREVSVMIAARAALRVLPLLNQLPTIDAERVDDIVLPVFRANALPWVAATYPTHGNELASRAADDASDASDAADAASDAAAAAAYAAADAAYAAAAAAADAASVAADAASDASASRATFSASDASLIEQGSRAEQVAVLPLWPEGISDDFQREWNSLKRSLLSLGQDWQVWTDWYEARLYGRPAPIEALELARAKIENEIWQQGPEVVNAHIRALIEEYTLKQVDDGDEDTSDLQQRNAPFTFNIDAQGRIDAKPQQGHPLSPQMAESLRAELVDKANEFLSNLSRTQAPDRIRKSANRLLEVLGNSQEDINPALLLARSRSLEADLDAYDTEDGRKELAEDVFASLKDLSLSVADLKACFPEIRQLEADTLAQGLLEGKTEEILDGVDELISVAETNHDALTKRALEGLKTLLPDIEALRDVIATSADPAKISAAMERLGWIALWHSMTAQNFSISVIEQAKRTAVAYTRDLRDHQTEVQTAVAISFCTVEMCSRLLLSPVITVASSMVTLGLSGWAVLPREAKKVQKELDELEAVKEGKDERSSGQNQPSRQ